MRGKFAAPSAPEAGGAGTQRGLNADGLSARSVIGRQSRPSTIHLAPGTNSLEAVQTARQTRDNPAGPAQSCSGGPWQAFALRRAASAYIDAQASIKSCNFEEPAVMTNILSSLGAQLPLMVVYLLGAVFALLQVGRWPRAAIFGAGGFGVLLLMIFVRTIGMSLLSSTLEMKPDAIHMVFTVVNFLFNVIEAACGGALLYAIFADRDSKPAAKGT
jgi:hypothetical protein